LADGEIDSREAAIIRQTYARAGFSMQDLREVDRVVEECQRRFFVGGSDAERLFRLLRDACAAVMQHSNELTRFGFVRAAISIAGSDGFISSEEERALRATANWLGLAKADYDRLWRSVLDTDPDDPQEAETSQ